MLFFRYSHVRKAKKRCSPRCFFKIISPSGMPENIFFAKIKVLPHIFNNTAKLFWFIFSMCGDVRRYGCKAPGRRVSRARDALLPARFTDFFYDALRRAKNIGPRGSRACRARVGGPPQGATGRGRKVRRESQGIGIRINGILPAVIAWV